MANTWGIPEWLERKLLKEIRYCVYCGVALREYHHRKSTPGEAGTWEHIDNDGPSTEENVVRCCGACNKSKGRKELRAWFSSSYCVRKGISEETMRDARILKYLETHAR